MRITIIIIICIIDVDGVAKSMWSFAKYPLEPKNKISTFSTFDKMTAQFTLYCGYIEISQPLKRDYCPPLSISMHLLTLTNSNFPF